MREISFNFILSFQLTVPPQKGGIEKRACDELTNRADDDDEAEEEEVGAIPSLLLLLLLLSKLQPLICFLLFLALSQRGGAVGQQTNQTKTPALIRLFFFLILSLLSFAF